MKLNELKNSSRPYQRRKLLGRGVGSKRGKTCCRGHKGAGSRSGWKSRARYEGGQLPLYRKLPERGFSNAGFRKRLDSINLGDIDRWYEDGEVVNLLTLREKNIFKGVSYGLKVLGHGELTKKVTIEANALSEKAQEKLQQAGIVCTIF
jgi:large subunit ribosomal protein L15